jgi:hypothetical protein
MLSKRTAISIRNTNYERKYVNVLDKTMLVIGGYSLGIFICIICFTLDAPFPVHH